MSNHNHVNSTISISQQNTYSNATDSEYVVTNVLITLLMFFFLFSITVPAPTVHVAADSASIPFAGSALSLNCTATINQYVDVDTNVSIIWRRGIDILTTYDRYTVETTAITDHFYLSHLQIIPLSGSLDSGEYTCAVEVVAPSSDLVATANGYSDITIVTQGSST